MKKRIISFTIIISLLSTSIIGRTAYIMMFSDYTVAKGYNSYSIIIDRIEPTLYYSNGVRINNNNESFIALIRPNEKCIGELNKLFSNSERQEILEELKKGYPITRTLDNYKQTKYIDIFETYSTSSTCNQLISKASSGLLSHLSYQEGYRKVNFTIDANGRILSGDKGSIQYEHYYDKNNGIYLTLDNKLQKICYNACNNMKSGCVIVMDVNNSNILACVNKPDNSYINNCFSQYSVGSVFKLIVATCALDNNVDIHYNCNGSIQVNDTKFSCQKNHKHKNQNLKQALANSCNCYFVKLALTLGEDKLLKTCNDFGFNTSTNIVNDWNIKNAVLPSNEILKSKGQLALFGFGQGALTSSPLQICSMLCTIANNGQFNKPRLFVEDAQNTQIISKETANTLVEYMRYVVTNGTGVNAESTINKSAGKTATAQTGQYEFGKEKLDTWFAGIYPYDSPKYAIVVMTENGTSGSTDCCPIFRTIVENIITV